ncbi:MAG: tetratricopeptide repeat protein, partial [Proteobacteria bacterium]|nr:tetratricopeptide repeat protein [Pseudomonadota bacterium]
GMGSIALMENRYTDAEEYLLKALKLDQDNNPIRMILADLYAKQGRVEEAQNLAEGLIKDNPENIALRYGLGEFLLKRGLTNEAEAQYLEILKEDPFKLEARDRLYDIYLSHNEKEKAKKLTEEIVAKNKDLPGTKYFMGRDAELDRKFPEALELFLKTIGGLNTFAPAFRKAGLLEISKGDTKTGVQHLNQAVALDPADIGARLTLGQIAIAELDYSKAKDHVNRILEKFPKQLGANVMRADIALLEGNTKEARNVYQFLIDSFPTFSSGYFKMALLEEQEKNYDPAIANYRKTVSFDTNVLLPAQRLAALLILKNGNQKAREEFEGYFQKSVKSKGEFKLVLATLTLSNMEDSKRMENARVLYHEAAELNPSLIGAYFAIGAIDAQTGNIDSAIENYKKVLEKNKTTLPPYILLALAYEGKKDFKNAEETYRKTLEVAPRFAPAANNLAYLLAEKIPNGNLDDALRFAQIAKESLSQDPGVADTLGWVNYKRGSKQVALANLQEAVQLDKKSSPEGKQNAEILYHLAIVYKDLNQLKEAKDTIALAIKLSTDNKQLQNELLEFSKNLR